VRSFTISQGPDDASLCKARIHFEAPFGEMLAHDPRRTQLFVCEFGMSMNIAAEALEPGARRLDFGYDVEFGHLMFLRNAYLIARQSIVITNAREDPIREPSESARLASRQ
jgi:hypothetical protein